VAVSIKIMFSCKYPDRLIRSRSHCLCSLSFVASCPASAVAGRLAPQEKAESVTPIPTLSPPEGNTTFIDGVTWCVARPGATQEDLQSALDWACGPGGADCSQLQPGGRCYQPDTLLTHASYAFNIFYQQNGNSDVACNFGGAGALVKRDPSTDRFHPPSIIHCRFWSPAALSSDVM
jgi:hypothetical protein